MAKMIMMWKRPEDSRAFEEHYFRVHVPLAKNLPGLQKYEVSIGSIVTRSGPSAETHLVAILHFESMDAIKQAFATPAGEACAQDRRLMAPNDDDTSMFLFDDREV
jgi:uncharacterized protein (TIGR02118 family)